MSQSQLTLFTLTLAALASIAQPVQSSQPPDNSKQLFAGFAEKDITPDWQKRPVYLAGFGRNRKATGVLDPIMARALVLRHGKTKIALVSVDLVGLFFQHVESIRKKLPAFDYILVSSTHNHEGPDTIGIWGPNLITTGVDSKYMEQVEKGVIVAIQKADKAATTVTADIGSANAPELLHDGREPYVKHDELIAIRLTSSPAKKLHGIIVQWNCHPETLGSKNPQISADFVGHTVSYLRKKYQCPVIYFTGTVGGLMTSLHVRVKDENGKSLADGTVAKTKRYGELIGRLTERALDKCKPIRMTPFGIHRRSLFLPIDNKLYKLAWSLDVFQRTAFLWTGDPNRAAPLTKKVTAKTNLCLQTEVGWLQLGELSIAMIPGEIYPELVMDRVQDPFDAGADFRDAAKEPAVYRQLPGPYRMMIGLANDEIGYIIPKRQWDVKAPFCYGRKRDQYGEENSLGSETAPLLCEGFRKMVQKKPEIKKDALVLCHFLILGRS